MWFFLVPVKVLHLLCMWLLCASRLVLLVRGALPGEALVARLTAVKKGMLNAS
jgi:hypothetical protein